MFKPHRMKKVTIAGSKDLLEQTIDTLFELRSIHLMDFKKDDPDFRIGTPLKEAASASEKLLKLRSAGKVLDVDPGRASEHLHHGETIPISDVESGLQDMILEIDRTIMMKCEVANDIENQSRELERFAEELLPFAGLPLKLEDYKQYSNLAVFVGTLRADPGPAIAKAFGPDGPYAFYKAQHKEGHLIALFIAKDLQQDASKLLFDLGFNDVRPPDGSGLPKAVIANLEAKNDFLHKKKAEIEKDLKALSKKHAKFLLASEEHLRIKVEKAEAPLKFATSPNAFVLEGFVPIVHQDMLVDTLRDATEDRLFIDVQDPSKADNIPVAFENPAPAKPFETLTNLVGRPNYEEIDPSMLVFVTMPLFFGLMLGDVGYALAILVAVGSGVMTRLWKFLGMGGAATQLNMILFWCAISSLVFGFLYNELFGFEMFAVQGGHAEATVVFTSIYYPEFTIPRVLAFGPAHFPVVRFENVLELLKLTVWIGVGHNFLGLCIGFRNKYVAHGLAHAIFEKGSWILILIGGVIVFYFVLRDIGGFVHLTYATTAQVIGLVMIIMGCVLLIKGEGAMGLIHLPSLMSNTMSYARILAIGLSSVGIALAFNKMAVDLWVAGGASMIGAALVFFIGHFINVLLGILGPGLHSLRLHYVEFFVKFYDGGGTPYSPFGHSRRFTSKGGHPPAAEGPDPITTEPKVIARIT